MRRALEHEPQHTRDLGDASLAIISLGVALALATLLVHLLPTRLIDNYGDTK